MPAGLLLHPAVPQPAGGRTYRCLTEFPGRTPGSVVQLSTLTSELDGGALWHQIGDWERVLEAVVKVARTGRCDAVPLGLPDVAAALLAGGQQTVHELHHPDSAPRSGRPAGLGNEIRARSKRATLGYRADPDPPRT